MNAIFIHGNLGRDMEIVKAGDKQIVAKGSVAVKANYAPKGQERKTYWMPVSIFMPVDSKLPDYLTKGRELILKNGEYQTNEWEKDGQKMYGHNFVFNSRDVEFCGGGGSGAKSEPTPAPVAPENDFTDLSDDIPF